MKKNLKIETKSKNYNIQISDEPIEKIWHEINLLSQDKKRLFVISKRVYKLYKDIFNVAKEELFLLDDGENKKNFDNYFKIIKKCMSQNFTRDDIIIAIGGGVVGDIAGFAASTYMRGIDFIQVPTTLLAMVDSSVGGKTAINLVEAKNIIGSFWQPKAVFININFLKTLNKIQFQSGLGEVLKYAFIEKNCDYKIPIFLFEFLTLCAEKVFAYDNMTLIKIIEYCLLLKSAVVNKDETEQGLRKILNFGHTLGHAIETYTHYKKVTHGQAVVWGIFFALNWSYAQNKIPYSYYRLSIELLEKYGFQNIDLRKNFKIEKLINIMLHDKKAHNNKLTFIIPTDKKTVELIELSQNEVREMF